MGIKTEHSDLLNQLDEMADSAHYALRRNVLRAAETIILLQENHIRQLKEQLNGKQKTGADTDSMDLDPS